MLSKDDRLPLVLLGLVAAVFVWSGWRPTDRVTWWLEILPVLIAVPALIATRRRFPWTTLTYVLGCVHLIILMVGGHYTYAEVPLGDWAAEAFDFSRNHYDRLGHVAQGFLPAIAMRELALRSGAVRRGGWTWVVATCVPLAFSAFYEMLEWWAALASEEASASFLGTQGDNWDTQWDMFLCLCGALAAQVLLGRFHDRQIAAFVDSHAS